MSVNRCAHLFELEDCGHGAKRADDKGDGSLHPDH